MKKILLLFVAFIPPIAFAQSQNDTSKFENKEEKFNNNEKSWIANFLSRTGELLGFNGGEYKTEVPIPIQEIRYQRKEGFVRPNINSDNQAYSENVNGIKIYVIDYSKSFYSEKLAEPYLNANSVYSLGTDPFTGEKFFVLRHYFRFMDKCYPQFNPNSSNCAPYPIDEAQQQPIPSDQTHPQSGSQQGGLQPLIDPSATAIKEFSDTAKDDGKNILAKHYIFIPDGGKFPNFSQVLLHQFYIGGPLAGLLRVRPAIPKSRMLPAIPQNTPAPNLTLGFVLATKHTLWVNKNSFSEIYKHTAFIEFPLFMFGGSTVSANLEKNSLTTDNGALDSYSTTGTTEFALTYSTGVGFQYNQIAFMLLAGKDNLLGSDGRLWPYQNKWWYGLSIGISLDKLLGIGSSNSSGGAGNGSAGGSGNGGSGGQ